jgi:hypothetical protein
VSSTCAKHVHKLRQVIFSSATKTFTTVNQSTRDLATIVSIAPSQELTECTSVRKMTASTTHANNVLNLKVLRINSAIHSL